MKTAMPPSGCMSMPSHNGFVMQHGNSCPVSAQNLYIFSRVSEKYVMGGGGIANKCEEYSVKEQSKYILIGKSYLTLSVFGGFFLFSLLTAGKISNVLFII
ncbi:MAG: hypothetical protein LBL42_00190 [Tannerella sp.]|jgi:hypothetical protein|nr:hypothetical protein [Tannerella sp.]